LSLVENDLGYVNVTKLPVFCTLVKLGGTDEGGIIESSASTYSARGGLSFR